MIICFNAAPHPISHGKDLHVFSLSTGAGARV